MYIAPALAPNLDPLLLRVTEYGFPILDTQISDKIWGSYEILHIWLRGSRQKGHGQIFGSKFFRPPEKMADRSPDSTRIGGDGGNFIC